MKTSEHRKAIVRALIASLHNADETAHPIAFADEENKLEARQHGQVSTCTVTGLFFPDRLSQQCITLSQELGCIWMGLWLDEELILHDGDNDISRAVTRANVARVGEDDCHGCTLFPRWLAEVLNEFDVGVLESDIYDSIIVDR